MANIIQIDLNKMLKDTPFAKQRVVGVALSGGRDSVALCHALRTAGENVVAINVEHGIRGENSLRDSEFVKDFCKAQGIKLYSFSVDVPSFAKSNGYTTEQAARILRYQVFDKAIDDGICDVVALAHHAGDQAETILMHILRGTGIKGLVGMQEVNGRYIRPLLNVSREDIDEYISKHNLPFVNDETNDDLSYSRNFLRAEIARLKERYPDLEKSFAKLSKTAFEADDYLNSVLPKTEVYDNEVHIKTADCANSFVFKCLVLDAAKALGVCQDVEEKHLNAVENLLACENGKMLNLTHGLVAYKEADGIVLTRDFETKYDDTIQKLMPFEVGDYAPFKVSVKVVENVSDAELKSGEALFADIDKFPVGCVVRTRKDGDFIQKFGGGTKSVGDFLTDKKVPLRTRDRLAVVASGDEVLAIFGVEISAKVKVDGSTKHIIKLSKILE